MPGPDELDWIARLRPLAGSEAAARLMDDAAVMPTRPGFDLVLTKDALVEGVHVAIFCIGQAQEFFAIDNVDPKSKASVLSRGLVGSLGDRIVVASPLYKNHFDLRNGECLESPEHSVRAHAVRVEQGRVQVALA